MKAAIKNIVQKLVVKKVNEDEALISSGLIDSVIIVELILEIEKELGISVALDEVSEQNFDSINKLHQYLLGKM
ncbi:acyl carrier protein [Bathymodiolus septemdierum thioautotrophic gill symbiont]|uniref:acyl carrier protein n=1 Tax=Bathymodiolus septemdierum thioautotrophic gill symbiont TaxID=113267 RepID=UPI000824EBD6|nr:phosphopantetheine-binding protein [Bathymodiolus septemdierum thioautotrophic gill symbiont]